MLKIYRVVPILTQSVIYTVTIILFKIFGRFRVYGLENVLNIEGPVLFAPNHSSEWDGILVRVALPFFSKRWSPMYYVSMVKEKYTDSGWRKLIYGGTLFNMVGAYPVYSGKKDYAYSLQNHIQILKNGSNLCLFPEGKRTKDGMLGKAHGGIAFLSHTLQIPVVPVSIKGLVRFTVKDFFSFKKEVSLYFGTILTPETIVPNPEPSVEDYQRGAETVLREVAKKLQ